ncbi:conserved hypothetical protein [Nocardia seriolae]|nr:conserved hypothetical protein [Nocardia seriolae]
MMDNELPTIAMLLPPTGNPGEQEFTLEELANGNVSLRNVKNMGFLGTEGDLGVNMPVLATGKQCEWALYQASQPFTFHIVVPGGPVDGVELALDNSLLRIYPPRLALRPLDVNNPYQAWRFQFHE